jgi:hypothetical protein
MAEAFFIVHELISNIKKINWSLVHELVFFKSMPKAYCIFIRSRRIEKFLQEAVKPAAKNWNGKLPNLHLSLLSRYGRLRSTCEYKNLLVHAGLLELIDSTCCNIIIKYKFCAIVLLNIRKLSFNLLKLICISILVSCLNLLKLGRSASVLSHSLSLLWFLSGRSVALMIYFEY